MAPFVHEPLRAERRWSPYRVPPQRRLRLLRSVLYVRRQLLAVPAVAFPRYPLPGVIPVPVPGGRLVPVYTLHPFVPTYNVPPRPLLVLGPGPLPIGSSARPPFPRLMLQLPPVPVLPRLPITLPVLRLYGGATLEPLYRDVQPYRTPQPRGSARSRRRPAYPTWRKYATRCLGDILKVLHGKRGAREGDSTEARSELPGPAASQTCSIIGVKKLKTVFLQSFTGRTHTKLRSGHNLIRPKCWFDTKGRSYIPEIFQELSTYDREIRGPTRYQPNPIVSSPPPTPPMHLYLRHYIVPTGAGDHSTRLSTLPPSPHRQETDPTMYQPIDSLPEEVNSVTRLVIPADLYSGEHPITIEARGDCLEFNTLPPSLQRQETDPTTGQPKLIVFSPKQITLETPATAPEHLYHGELTLTIEAGPGVNTVPPSLQRQETDPTMDQPKPIVSSAQQVSLVIRPIAPKHLYTGENTLTSGAGGHSPGSNTLPPSSHMQETDPTMPKPTVSSPQHQTTVTQPIQLVHPYHGERTLATAAGHSTSSNTLPPSRHMQKTDPTVYQPNPTVSSPNRANAATQTAPPMRLHRGQNTLATGAAGGHSVGCSTQRNPSRSHPKLEQGVSTSVKPPTDSQPLQNPTVSSTPGQATKPAKRQSKREMVAELQEKLKSLIAQTAALQVEVEEEEKAEKEKAEKEKAEKEKAEKEKAEKEKAETHSEVEERAEAPPVRTPKPNPSLMRGGASRRLPTGRAAPARPRRGRGRGRGTRGRRSPPARCGCAPTDECRVPRLPTPPPGCSTATSWKGRGTDEESAQSSDEWEVASGCPREMCIRLSRWPFQDSPLQAQSTKAALKAFNTSEDLSRITENDNGQRGGEGDHEQQGPRRRRKRGRRGKAAAEKGPQGPQ